MADLPVDPPDDPRLSELQAHARALGLQLRVELVREQPDQEQPFGFTSQSMLPASELSEDR